MKKERIEEIAEILDKRGKMTLEQLEKEFPNVSQMTLRRDLYKLEEDKRIIRVRGGAMSVKEVQKVSGEAYTKKTTVNTDAKIIIAQKAATLIDEDSCIFLDGGTTAMYLSKEIPDIKCNIFTNGIAVAMELAQKKNVNITVVGGQLMKDNLSTSSPASKDYFASSNFELAIVSATAFTPENGFSCNNQSESELLKMVLQKARHVYMMLDSSKIGKINPYTFAYISDIDVLITDDKFPREYKSLLEQENVVVM
ncbi:MAG: DeoR/GlpR family DNA-binding transcription regulator [Candidatus Coproplasma sp.]